MKELKILRIYLETLFFQTNITCYTFMIKMVIDSQNNTTHCNTSIYTSLSMSLWNSPTCVDEFLNEGQAVFLLQLRDVQFVSYWIGMIPECEDCVTLFWFFGLLNVMSIRRQTEQKCLLW